MNMKKILAVLACASLISAVPAYAAEIEYSPTADMTVFQAGADTSWTLWENAGNSGSAVVGETTLTAAKATAAGDTVTLTIPDTYTSTTPVQMKTEQTGITLVNGVEYTFSVDYAASLTAYTNTNNQNVVYMQAIARYSDNTNTTVPKTGINHKSGDTADLTKSGTITGTLTPTQNGTLELQLYLRHAQGSVTFSNLKVTTTVDNPLPATAVASTDGKYFDNVIDALKVVPNNGTIEVYKDSTLSERALLDKLDNTAAKNITINGNSHKITAPDNTMAFEVPSGYNLTFNDAVIVGGTNYTVNVKKGGTLNLINTTVGASDAAKPALNVSGTVNASGTSTIYSMLFGNTGDGPAVNLADSAALVGTIKPTNTTVTIAENYALITGATANCTAEYSNSSNKDYELVDGVFVKKAEVITMTPEFVGTYTSDIDASTAAAYRAKFTSSTGATASLNAADITWKLDDAALNVSSGNTTTTITLNGTSEVVYGIIISGAQSGTLSAVFN